MQGSISRRSQCWWSRADYVGSYDDWKAGVVRDLIERYMTGKGGASTTNSQIGAPDPNDYNLAATDPYAGPSYQTYQYWNTFVDQFGSQSPYIVDNYGPPPDRNASYQIDPNSPAALQGTFDQRRAADIEDRDFAAGEAAKDRSLSRELSAADNAARIQAASISAAASNYAADAATERARLQEAGATQRTSMQIEASWREAQLADATRRYIAEGEWGTQRWVTEANNQASMERLNAQLGFQREELAQRAIEEQNRHHATMVSLALEVARYDAELAASPRNLYAYAAWLSNRNIVVNGMTLSVAAQEVPIESIDPAEVAATGDNLAAIYTAQDQEGAAPAGGTSDPAAIQATEMVASGQVPQQTTATQFANGAIPQTSTSPGAEQLAGETDYQSLANQLLGQNPLQPNEADVSTQNLQSIENNLQTAGRNVASFGSYTGPTTNSLGVEIQEPSGHLADYRQFTALLPSEQDAKLAGVESIRGPSGVSDWIGELEKSRPRGKATGVSSFG
ncbi:MAG: hypothetical protein R3C29_15805 [Dehalococcoidia bacterium]|nr:hypothetical protein [Dehalococcoidia bacterium]